jgi:hypothetical protein
MFGRLTTHRGVFGLAILLLLFAPGVAYADKVVESESDHSNQDGVEPDVRKSPAPIDPARWGGRVPQGSGGADENLGLPSIGGANFWIADALTGAPPPPPVGALVVPGYDVTFEGPPVGRSLGLDGLGLRSQTSGIGGGAMGPPPVPEPASAVLLLLGGALLAARRRN